MVVMLKNCDIPCNFLIVLAAKKSAAALCMFESGERSLGQKKYEICLWTHYGAIISTM